MKVLFITRAYGKNKGGMERLSYEMIDAVSSEPNVTAQVIAYSGSRSLSPLFNLTALPRAISQAKQADVVHIGDPMLAFLGWVVKKITRKPVVVHVHGLDILYPNFFYQLYLKLFFKKFAAYFCISNYVGQLLTTHYSLKAQILTPGISDRYFDPAIKPTSDKKVLFTAGRLVKRKGHAWFIKHVLPKLPKNVIYVIAGDGPERENLRSLSLHFGSVKLLGKVSENQLKILYNTADAFIQSNIPVPGDAEGFGLVLLEAALCQRQVFASNIDGIPDAIHDGQNGTLLPPLAPDTWAAALNAFLKNPRPNPQAREYTLNNFSWKNQAPRYIKKLSDLLE